MPKGAASALAILAYCDSHMPAFFFELVIDGDEHTRILIAQDWAKGYWPYTDLGT